ncbi:MAG: hypothetical protein RL235_96 [Chlamydiota bacterium]|jgi:carboxyl-terminal processing protease
MLRYVIQAIVLFLWIATPLASVQTQLKLGDVSRVMDKLFNYHIEMRELTTALVKRSLKLYIESFDPEKVYLLESEASQYLNLSDAQAQQILKRLRAENYSDFIELNELCQRAVARAKETRVEISNQLINNDLLLNAVTYIPASQYAAKEADLVERQKVRMVRFYLFHQARTRLDTKERRMKVYQLFERKIGRFEGNYLYSGHRSKERAEHALALRILKCLAKSLDTHTTFFSPEEAYDMRLNLEKQFEGVGIILSEGIDGVLISDIIPGSSAARSGKIRPGDVLAEIDGVSLVNLSFEEVLEQLKKKDRGQVILGVVRTGEERLIKVILMKQPIAMEHDRIEVSTETFGNGVIGKISLHSFYESSDGISSERDIKEAIRKFREQGELVGLVLDLRENSGGFLNQAVRVAGLFVSSGVIVISKYGKGETHYLRNLVNKSYFNGPLVVLTSKMSASASEIVAQALQDYGVALVVGDERTFGKGSIQYQTVTDASAEHYFKVTVGRYYTVSGKSTQIHGVIADILVPTQYAPYKIGERFLEYPLAPDQVAPAFYDSLSDLDDKTKTLFQARYMPFLQRVVPYWKKMLPTLQRNSAYRIDHDLDYQAFFKRQEKVKERLQSLPVNTIDEEIRIGQDDIQMKEAVNIVKDMVLIEAESRPATASSLAPTGTDY